MEQAVVLVLTLLTARAFADVNPDLLDRVFSHRQTKEVKDSESDNHPVQPVLYSGFDRPILAHLDHWKPEKPKPHLPHIPNLSDLAILLKPTHHGSHVNKPDHYHHKPESHSDNKNEAVYPILYPLYYPAGLPHVWDYMLLNNLYHPDDHGDYHTAVKPHPCHTTPEPPTHYTTKPGCHYPIQHDPVHHTTTNKPEHYYTGYSTHKPDDYHHQYEPHHSKPRPSKQQKPSLSSIFPQFLWPFYSRPKDTNPELEDSRPPSVAYPYYDVDKKTVEANIRPNEEKNNEKNTAASEAKSE